MSPRTRDSRKISFLRCAAGFLLAQAAFGVLLLAFMTWWIDSSDPPAQSDILVVLSGNNYHRTIFGAELYAQGYAPQVWISRPTGNPGEDAILPLGIRVTPEEDINRAILVRKGVPAARIHLYGHNLQSTADEAMTLRRSLPSEPKRMLIVTSRPHARRARLIFRHYFPDAAVRVTATPYDEFTLRWWKNRGLAHDAILESAKTAYFLLGGRFTAGPT